MNDYDIIVVGASTTGSWFAAEMAKRGHSVLVLEKEEKDRVSRSYDIFHMGKEDMERFGLPIPQEGDEAYGFCFSSGRNYSPYGHYPKGGINHVIGMHKHAYIMKMNAEAEVQGAEILYGAPFHDFVRDEKGNITGVTYTHSGELRRANCRLVADCSGIPSAARRKLPDTAYVENFPLTQKDIFYVVLYYVTYEDEKVDPMALHGSFMQYKAWSAPSGDSHGAILGVGANFSYDYAEEIFRDFRKNIPWPKYRVDKVEKGMTPYHRGLYSFVDNGFIAMGDAACLTKPTCGEGCTSALYQAEIAVDVISGLLKKGEALTRENMWSINRRYMEVQGKSFDSLRPILIGAVNFNYDEAEYLFSKDIIFSSSILGNMEGSSFTAAEGAKTVSGIIGGMIRGKLRPAPVKKLLQGLQQSKAVEALYDDYPETPTGYFQWKKRADALWEEIGTMADACQRDDDRV